MESGERGERGGKRRLGRDVKVDYKDFEIRFRILDFFLSVMGNFWRFLSRGVI